MCVALYVSVVSEVSNEAFDSFLACKGWGRGLIQVRRVTKALKKLVRMWVGCS